MKQSYPVAPLGDVIRQRSEFIEIDDFKAFKRCRVQLHAQGIVLRDIVQGTEIKTKKQQVCHSGEFLVAEIDAKVGGFGIVPDDLDGAIVSSHYFLFDLDTAILNKSFLGYFVRTPAFMEQVKAQGTTNYAAIRPGDVLRYKIPLPPLEEQQRIVGQIEELAVRIEEARRLRREAVEEAEALVLVSLSRIFDYDIGDRLPVNWSWQYLSDILINGKEGISTGPFGTLLGKSDIQSEGIPILGIANVQANRFVPGFNDYISVQKANSLSRYKLEADDIVIARSGTVGRSCVLPCINPSPIMSTNLLRLRLRQDIF